MGNRARMRSLLREIKQLGLVVHFAGIDLNDEEEASTKPYIAKWVTNFSSRSGRTARAANWQRLKGALLRKLGHHREYSNYELYESVDRWMTATWIQEAADIQQSAKYPRVLVPYVFHSAFFDAFDQGCRKILDTHDKFAGRRERLAKAGIADYWFTTTEDEERKAVRRADVVLAIQSHEAIYFANLVDPGVLVREVGHFAPQLGPLRAPQSNTCNQIGILASSNPLNVDGLKFFLFSVWPLVREKHPQASLKIAGDAGPQLGDVPAGVDVLGPIVDIANFYRSCLCTVNPIRVGTGLKIKSLESLAHGCPLVATPTAAEGLEMCSGKGLVIATDAQGMADGLVHWLRNPVEAAAAGDAGIRSATELNARWRKGLADALGLL